MSNARRKWRDSDLLIWLFRAGPKSSIAPAKRLCACSSMKKRKGRSNFSTNQRDQRDFITSFAISLVAVEHMLAPDARRHQPCTPEEQALSFIREAQSFYELKRFDKAVDILTKAIALWPMFFPAWSNRASCHAFQENWKSALADSHYALCLLHEEGYGTFLRPDSAKRLTVVLHWTKYISSKKLGLYEGDLLDFEKGFGITYEELASFDAQHGFEKLLGIYLRLP